MISLHVLLPDRFTPLDRELHFQAMPRVGDHLMLDLGTSWSPFRVRKVVHAAIEGLDAMRSYLVLDAEGETEPAVRHDPPPSAHERADHVEWWHKLGWTPAGRMPPHS